MASFLLGEVYGASSTFRTVDRTIPQADSWALFLGETWKATSKLSINLGVRWDVARPSYEKNNTFSFLDIYGTNPGAGGRPGRLAFAGSDWGAASSGRRHPEDVFYKGFAPRLGIAYSLSPKTVIRTGYGMFLGQAYYPGWEGGITTDGFNTTATVSPQTGGYVPAFNLEDGFPQNFAPPPILDVTAFNGQNTDAPQ